MNGPRRNVEFVNVAVEALPAGAQRARVQLWRRGTTASSGEKFLGTAEAVDLLRAAAEATIQALRQAQTEASRIQHVVGVEQFEALGSELVGTSVAAFHGGELRLLMGFCRVRGYEKATAACRAVLDATNRFLGAR